MSYNELYNIKEYSIKKTIYLEENLNEKSIQNFKSRNQENLKTSSIS